MVGVLAVSVPVRTLSLNSLVYIHTHNVPLCAGLSHYVYCESGFSYSSVVTICMKSKAFLQAFKVLL